MTCSSDRASGASVGSTPAGAREERSPPRRNRDTSVKPTSAQAEMANIWSKSAQALAKSAMNRTSKVGDTLEVLAKNGGRVGISTRSGCGAQRPEPASVSCRPSPYAAAQPEVPRLGMPPVTGRSGARPTADRRKPGGVKRPGNRVHPESQLYADNWKHPHKNKVLLSCCNDFSSSAVKALLSNLLAE